jgi:1-acyl-sn-glycerol-3-phosphate acyltransferase
MEALKEKLKDGSLRIFGQMPYVHGHHETARSLADDPDACASWFQDVAKGIIIPSFDRVGVDIRGAGNIPSSGPMVLAPSHIDQTDPFTGAHIALSERPDLVFRFLAKHQLDRPVIQDFLLGSVVYINRVKTQGQTDEEKRLYNEEKMRMLAEAIASVEDGHGAGMIFPWGTREKKGSLPARIGVFLLAGNVARLTGQEVPVVMMGLAGNTVGKYLTRLVVPGSETNIAAVIPEPIIIKPNFLDYLKREGEHGEHVQPTRDLMRLQLHACTADALTIVGDNRSFGYLDEPSDEKKRKRVSSSTTSR